MKRPLSVTEKRVKELKGKFVVDLYLGRGDFWRNVKVARINRRVEVREGLPPPQLLPLFVADDLMRLKLWPPFVTEALKRLQSLPFSIGAVWRSAVPQKYWAESDWDAFAAACILYDPPELELDEFAEYGGLTPEGGVEWIDSEGRMAAAVEEYYQRLLEEVWSRRFGPYSENVWEVVSQIHSETDLLENLATRTDGLETHPYVSADRNPAGRPPIIESLAIKCAALYYDHNGSDDTTDKRIKRWTHARLAKEIILPHPNSPQRSKSPKDVGARYVRAGEKLREMRRKNRRNRSA